MDTSLTTSENSTCSTVLSCPITNDNNSSDDGIDDTPTMQYINSNNNNNNNSNNNDPVVCFNCYVDPNETHTLSEQVFSSEQKEEEEVKDASPNSNNNPNSDESSIQLSSDSSTEMFSLSTLDDSLSSYFIKTPRRIETSKSSSNTHNKESDISSELPPETPEIASTPFSKTPSVPSIIKKSAIAKSLFPFSRSTDTSHQEEEEDSTGSNCFLQTSYDEGVEEDEHENEHRCCSLYDNEEEEEEEIDLPIVKLKESRMSKVKESSMSKVNLLYDNDQVISIQFGDGTDVRFTMDSTAEMEDDDQLRHQAASSSSVVSNTTEGWERGGWGPTTVQDEKGAPPSREHSLDDWKSTTFSVHEMATQTEISFRDNKRKHRVSWKTCCGEVEDEEDTNLTISQSQGGNAGCRWSCALI